MRTPKLKTAATIGGFALLHFLLYAGLTIVFGAREFRNVLGFYPEPNVFFEGLTKAMLYPVFAPVIERLVVNHEIGPEIIWPVFAVNSFLWGLAGWAILKRIKHQKHVDA